jgi:hypothetical protein
MNPWNSTAIDARERTVHDIRTLELSITEFEESVIVGV